jgi:hypothetical protein
MGVLLDEVMYPSSNFFGFSLHDGAKVREQFFQPLRVFLAQNFLAECTHQIRIEHPIQLPVK